jgi:SHS2 domain-containing protein
MAKAFFREIEHTADLGIEIEADSPADLFRCAGLALFSLMVNLASIQQQEERQEVVQAEGWEELLHDWLSLLLRRFLQEGFVAADLTIDEIDASHVRARLRGERLNYDRHEFEMEIKAVTYHQLAVTCVDGRWRARVIFDV